VAAPDEERQPTAYDVESDERDIDALEANIKPHSLCELECDEPISDLLKAEG
jgi:hypothetical protein